jgi:hypothetical protein
MRRIIVRTGAPRGEEPEVRFFNADASGPSTGPGLVAASPVDWRVLRARYGGQRDESPVALPRAAWTIRLG